MSPYIVRMNSTCLHFLEYNVTPSRAQAGQASSFPPNAPSGSSRSNEFFPRAVLPRPDMYMLGVACRGARFLCSPGAFAFVLVDVFLLEPIFRSCLLLPVLQNAFVPRGFHFSNTLVAFDRYYLGHWADLHAYEVTPHGFKVVQIVWDLS
jgi:hypothetical protein